jgi:hypothetical protein
LKKIVIKQEKQENGLWGSPSNCIALNGLYIPHDERKELIHSALLAAVGQYHYPTRFEFFDYSEDGFYVKFEDGAVFVVLYKRYEVDDNILYEFLDKDEKEHLVFLRKPKLKKLQYEII